MREQQFIRFVQQICYLLRLSQPCSKTALQYFMQFKEYENHGYDQEILVAACIYLSVKIFEEDVRIRDILNMVYVLTSLYRMSAQQADHEREGDNQRKGEKMNEESFEDKKMVAQKRQQQKQQSIRQQQPNQQPNQQTLQKIQEQKQHPQSKSPHLPQQPQPQQQQQHRQPYILLKNIQHLQHLHQLIQPKYSLTDYNQYKGKIIQAQQMLLRILGFSFSLSEQNKKELKRLLIIVHYLRMPQTVAETIIKVYNDLHYIDIDYWPEGVVYFGCIVAKVFVGERQIKKKKDGDNNIEMAGKINNLDIQQGASNLQNLQLKQFNSTGPQKKPNDKESAQINRINQFLSSMTPQKWQTLLATQIKLLQNYAQKLTNFYSSIHPHS